MKRLTEGQKRHDQAAAYVEGKQLPLWGVDESDTPSAERASTLASDAGERWGRALAIVVRSGAGITISGTRDGGALSLTLLNDGIPAKRYAATGEELGRLLDTLEDYCAARL
jgi:hypothetical protein